MRRINTIGVILALSIVLVMCTKETKDAFVSLSNLNVLYIGVENPIHLELIGLEPNELVIELTDGQGEIKRKDSINYSVIVSQPGDARIRISGNGFSREFLYAVKRVPDPLARLSNKTGGSIGSGEFKAQAGLGAFLDDFNFDCNCQIQGFNLTKIGRRQDPVEVSNAGPRYSSQSKRLIQTAKPGDVYLFSNVKVRCPGDQAGRPINSLAFMIR